MAKELNEKVYISGRITGVKNYSEPFNEAERKLTTMGFEVFNPCSMGEVDGWQWSDYMKKDLAALMSCNFIYPLKGWRQSRGARLEMKIAKKLNIPVLKI